MTEIRRARQTDIPQIAAIERDCFSLPWDENMLKTQLGDRYIFLVSEENGEIRGYVGLMFVLDEGYISNVAVAPGHRRVGLADALIKELLHIAKTKNLAFVTLEVRAGNLPAIALYKKHGFKAAGLRPGYYEKPREDALIMTYTQENQEV